MIPELTSTDYESPSFEKTLSPFGSAALGITNSGNVICIVHCSDPK